MTIRLPAAALLCAASSLFSTASTNAQSTLRVPSQYPDIQTALTAATTGDTVLIEPGLHFANNLDPLGKEVTIRGEFGPEQTVLDGQLQGRLFVVQNGEGPNLVIEGLTLRRALVPANAAGGALWVSGTASPTVRDCCIELCDGQQGTAAAIVDDAALLVEDSTVARNTTGNHGALLIGPSASLVMRRCALRDNRTATPGVGGGLISTPSGPTGTGTIGSLRLDGCTLRGNAALSSVVGVRGLDVALQDCVFEQHVTQSELVQIDLTRAGNSFTAADCVFRDNVGGGQLVLESFAPQNPMTVQRCRFANNYDGPVRGTLLAVRGVLTLEDSTFIGNRAAAQFGVIYFEAGGNPGRIRRCRIVDNWTASTGGVVRVSTSTDVRLESCLIARNINAGPFSAVLASGEVDIDHCTIVDNVSGAALPSGQVAVFATAAGTLQSSIVRGNAPLQLPPAATSSLTVTHCNVEGGIAGVGNFDADPAFLADGDGEWHLSSNSPCRDTGAAGTTAFDLDGTPRSAGAAPDVGCDEVPDQPFAATGDDLEMLALVDGQGDPYAPVLAPVVDAVLELTVRSPNGTLNGAHFLVLLELRANSAPAPALFPGLHINLFSPSFFIAYDSLAAPLPIGGLGLPIAGFSLRFEAPAGLAGSTAWIQAGSLTPAANNGILAMTRAVQVRMP